MYTIKDLLRRTLIINPEGVAVHDGDESCTWREFVDRVSRVAESLHTLGMKKGDRVAIYSLNSARYMELLFAVLWGGGVAVPVNTRYAPSELTYCLNDLDGCLIASDDEMHRTLEMAKPAIHGIKALIYMGRGFCPTSYVDYHTLLDGNAEVSLPEPHAEDIAMLIATGGTTGHPKAVMHSHRGLLGTAEQMMAGLGTIKADDVYLHVAPMFHAADVMMCLGSAIVGCANAFLAKFEMQPLVDLCNYHKVTSVNVVPTIAKLLCDYLEESGQSIPTIRTIAYGGAPMSNAIRDAMLKHFPGIQLTNCYGSTESMGVAILGPDYHTPDPANDSRLKTCGRACVGVFLSIQDPLGNELPGGELGEVCVRSNNLMMGYWNRPDLTREVMVDNWYHSGDAGFLDDKGFLTLVDRVKDMIISGGENVYSAEVETALANHAAVEECAVIGVPDETWGQRVHAVVKLYKGELVNEEDLRTMCREYISGYKVPKSIEFVIDALPKTAAGKLDKKALKEKAVRELMELERAGND